MISFMVLIGVSLNIFKTITELAFQKQDFLNSKTFQITDNLIFSESVKDFFWSITLSLRVFILKKELSMEILCLSILHKEIVCYTF